MQTRPVPKLPRCKAASHTHPGEFTQNTTLICRIPASRTALARHAASNVLNVASPLQKRDCSAARLDGENF
ncbi:hypothetical protein GGD63_006389 [Bradyrhizobium sp. cir1]|nr:hypothetical protein [Bradyrhizobium sp. cir1]